MYIFPRSAPYTVFAGTVALLISVTLSPSLSAAENFTIRSESMIRIFERNTSSETDAFILPAYEFLQIDVGEPDVTPLTFHAHGWGRIDLSDNDFFEDQADGELLYGYLQYQSAQKKIIARLGRQAVYAGVANESLTGILIQASLTPSMSLSAYAGQPVSLESTNGRSGDSIFGGRLGFRLAGKQNVGVSYKMIRNDSDNAEEMVGMDFGLSYNRLFLTGASSYNLLSDGFAEHSYEALFAADKTRYSLFYQHYAFEDYFGTEANNANPFRILAQTSEKLTSYGLEVTRSATETIDGGIKLARNDYDLADPSYYGALTAAWHGKDLSGIGGEFGLSKGDNDQNDMLLARIYGYQEMPGNLFLDLISLDLLFAMYDQEIYGEDTSIFISAAASRKILNKSLRLKVSADYESGPYFDNDVRGLLSLIYQYSNQ